MTGGLVSIPELREYAEQTLDNTLPYEETWHTLASGVLALVEAVEAAQVVYREFHAFDRPIYPEETNLRDALAKFSFEAAAGAGDNT